MPNRTSKTGLPLMNHAANRCPPVRPTFRRSIRHPSGHRVCLLLAWLLACAPASAALLVFSRTVETDAPYYTDIALDAAGNIHLSGFVTVDNVPRALVTKRSPDGATELWSLQFGAGTGQIATGIDVDAQGNVYVAGWTADPNFPLKNPLQGAFGGGDSDVFVLKVNAAGTTLLYSTFLGGADQDFANQIRVDPAGNIHLTGTTFSPDFPGASAARAGETDAFVVKLKATGSALIYSRLLGGSGGDLGNGLALDVQGRAYVIGSTASTNFPVLNPLQAQNQGTLDVFVAALEANGATRYATYLGGAAPDFGSGIAVDSAGNLLLTGLTFSEDFPLARAVQTSLKRAECFGNQICGDGFVAKLNAAGSALEFSTYLGGNRAENAPAITSATGLSFYGIGVDPAGFVYVTGSSESLDFPLIGGLQVSPRRGVSDPFLAKFQPDGSLVYATPAGPGQFRPGENRLNVASSVAVDARGNAYLAGVSLAPSAGAGVGTPPVGYLAKVFDLPVEATIADPTDPNKPPSSVRFTDIRRLADATSQLTFEVPADSGYVVEGSADLRAWTPLFTQPPPDGSGGGGGGIKQ